MLLDCNIDILGTPYRVCIATEETDKRLSNCDGFTDKTSHLIMVDDCRGKSNFDEPMVYIKKVLRHELIHAFMMESGLDECMMYRKTGHEEQMVDWFAHQFHKIRKAINDVNIRISQALLKEVEDDGDG